MRWSPSTTTSRTRAPMSAPGSSRPPSAAPAASVEADALQPGPEPPPPAPTSSRTLHRPRARPQARRPGRSDVPADASRAKPVAATASRPGGPLGAEDLDGARRNPGGCSPSPTPSTSLSSSTGPCSPGATSNGRVEGQGGDAAELVGNQKTLPRTKLLQQVKKRYLGRTAFRVEEGDARAWSPAETMSAKLADLPDGGSRSSGGGSRCGSTSGVVASSAAISLPRVNRRRGPLGALRLEAVSPLHRRRLHPDAPRVGRRCI